MLVVASFLVVLLAVHSSQLQGCSECGEETRGKLSFSGDEIIQNEDEYPKAIGLASPPKLVGVGDIGWERGGLSPLARFYHLTQQQLQNHQKILAQQGRLGLSGPSGGSPPSNLLHVLELLKGSGQPRSSIDDDYLLESGPLSAHRFAKKAERGMLVDVMDYVSKPDERNRRVGQSMRSSG